MNWNNFRTRNNAESRAFEALCNHLFENWLRREYGTDVEYFTTVNGIGGDGGIEAYALLKKGDIVAVQAKWFTNSLNTSRIGQIRDSIHTARKIRSKIKKYIVCIPRDLTSKKKTQKHKNEEERWDEFISQMKTEYPDLEINLWNDHSITRELQLPESEGIRRFWFEKEEFSIEHLKFHFEKALKGWLNQRYISDLHGEGNIELEANKLLMTPVYREKCLNRLNELKSKLQNSIIEIESYIADFPEDIKCNLNQLKKLLTSVAKDHVSVLKRAFQYGASAFWEKIKIEPEISKSLYLLKQQRLQKRHSNLIKNLNGLIDSKIDNLLSSFYFRIREGKVGTIFLGKPGTGKTHGLAALVDSWLLKQGFPAIIIQARAVSADLNWKEIISSAIGLATDWNEMDIWGALEVLSYKCDVKREVAREITRTVDNEPTKILICIDGIDEAESCPIWIERIGELKAVTKKFPRLRFVIASREYAIKGKTRMMENIGFSVIKIPPLGDKAGSELFESYIKHYKIRIDDATWIKWRIQTPLALKLFCELNRGKRVDQKADVTISNLIKRKVEKIDDEICQALGKQWSANDFVILNCLFRISSCFLNESKIERSVIAKEFVNAQTSNVLDESLACKLIDKMAENGVFNTSKVQSTDPLEPPTIFYEITYQPILEYFISRKIITCIRNSDKVNLKDAPVRSGVLRMVGIILLEDYNQLINDEVLQDCGLDKQERLELKLDVLTKVTPRKTLEYLHYIEPLLKESLSTCRTVLSDLIVPVARIKDHPLGPLFLHRILLSFKNVAERDIVWSGPQDMPLINNPESSVYCLNPIEGNQYNLSANDTHDGLPLIYAWSLTTVENDLRSSCRQELTKWGLSNLGEFIKLLDMTFKTNDPQMQEDLICCAFGITSLLEKGNEQLKTLAEWMLHRIFQEDNIKKINNVVIRFAARAVVERAYFMKTINKSLCKQARGPYLLSEKQIELMPLDDSVEDPSFWCFSIDVKPYIMKKSYQGFFDHPPELCEGANLLDWTDLPDKTIGNALSGKCGALSPGIKQYLESIKEKGSCGAWPFLELLSKGYGLGEVDDQEGIRTDGNMARFKESTSQQSLTQTDWNIDAFLKEHAKQIGKTYLKPIEFAMAGLKAYVLKMGWNKKVFYGKPNGGDPGETCGIDIAILRKYHPESHGERSKVMSFSEKYTWCFVHEVKGYFADRLKYAYGDGKSEKIYDYNLIEKIPNPAQDLMITATEKDIETNLWFLPAELSPDLKDLNDISKDTVTTWINTAPIPNFSKWLLASSGELRGQGRGPETDWLCLNSFNYITAPKIKCVSLFWITGFFITDNDLDLMLYDCKIGNRNSLSFLEPERLCTSIANIDSCSPQDAMWMSWLKESEPKKMFNTVKKGQLVSYEIVNTICDIIYETTGKTEQFFKIPSMKTRELAKIVKGDGKNFYNSKDELVAFSADAKSGYDSQEYFYIDKKHLEHALKRKGERIAWTIKLIRQQPVSNSFTQERLSGRLYRTWLFWEEDGDFKSLLLYSGSPD